MQFVNNALRKELAKTHWHINKHKKNEQIKQTY